MTKDEHGQELSDLNDRLQEIISDYEKRTNTVVTRIDLHWDVTQSRTIRVKAITTRKTA